MASVQEHYEQHLGAVYSWMLGDMGGVLEKARGELQALGLRVGTQGVAVDLGAGPGVYAIPLAELGFSVIALDSCAGLIAELQERAGAYPIRSIVGDLTQFRAHCPGLVELILCMGDTLTHLPSVDAVEQLFRDVHAGLTPGGVFVATFRDYVSAPLEGTRRFIPVRSDEERILTCFLEYGEAVVMVHDLLYVRGAGDWQLRVSSYPKLRLSPAWTLATLRRLGLDAKIEAGAGGMVRLIARNAKQGHGADA
jgi:SAM-dependent methyltransferase